MDVLIAVLIGALVLSIALHLLARRRREPQERMLAALRAHLTAAGGTVDEERLAGAVARTLPMWQTFVRDLALEGHALHPEVAELHLVHSTALVYAGMDPVTAGREAWQGMLREGETQR